MKLPKIGLLKKWQIVPLEYVLEDLSQKRCINVADNEIIREPTITSKTHTISCVNETIGATVRIKKRYKILPGDLVFSRLHTQNGAFAYSTEYFTPTSTFVPFRVIEKQIDRRFLFWALHVYVPTLTTSDSVGRETYKTRDILSLRIPFPPLDEQRRIVARIEKLTAKIEEARRLRAESVEETQLLVVSARYNLIFPEKANNWKTLLFNQAVDKPRGPNAGLPKKEYKSSGKFPVIDQGKEYIGGYTDDESRVFKVVAPVIVWGDHTTNSKLVDFDFVPGADGTKIFSPKEKLLAGYVNQFLKTVNYPEMGYSRHYRHLKKQQIPVPSLPEQRRIVNYVDKLQSQVDELRKYQAETQKQLGALTQSILSKAFKGEL